MALGEADIKRVKNFVRRTNTEMEIAHIFLPQFLFHSVFAWLIATHYLILSQIISSPGRFS
jgi:hypothetical protein